MGPSATVEWVPRVESYMVGANVHECISVPPFPITT